MYRTFSAVQRADATWVAYPTVRTNGSVALRMPRQGLLWTYARRGSLVGRSAPEIDLFQVNDDGGGVPFLSLGSG